MACVREPFCWYMHGSVAIGPERSSTEEVAVPARTYLSRHPKVKGVASVQAAGCIMHATGPVRTSCDPVDCVSKYRGTCVKRPVH